MQGTSKLLDQWADVTDSKVAHSIASSLKLTLPVSSSDHSQLSICDQCKTINFLSNEINIDRDLEAIRTDSGECSLCKVLHKALSKTSAATSDSFQLFRSGSTWKEGSSSEPVLTVYSSLSPYPFLEHISRARPLADNVQIIQIHQSIPRLTHRLVYHNYPEPVVESNLPCCANGFASVAKPMLVLYRDRRTTRGLAYPSSCQHASSKSAKPMITHRYV